MCLIFFIIFIGSWVKVDSSAVLADSWCYEGADCGPSHWPGQCGSKKAQSPIDLSLEGSPEDGEQVLTFNFDYFRIHENFFILNNGHSVQVQLREEPDSSCQVEGAGLEGYTFAQLHFHWGLDSTRGSEHTVDSKSYPMEVHLVHYANKYGSLTKALENEDPKALAVLGVFFQITSQDNPAIQSIINNIPSIINPESKKLIAATGQLNLMGLLPSKLDLWRYEGSLTTPNCDEKVIWSVFQKPISISETQMAAFRGLMDTHGAALVNNFRPPQAEEGRQVKILRLNQPQLIEEDQVDTKKVKDVDLIVALSVLGAVVLLSASIHLVLYLRLKNIKNSTKQKLNESN